MSGTISIEQVNRLEAVLSWGGDECHVAEELLGQVLEYKNIGALPVFQIIEHDPYLRRVTIRKMEQAND